MASLRKRPSGYYYLEYRYGGRHYHRSLETDNLTEARQFKCSVERTLKLIKEGVLHLKDSITADELWQFLRSGGRRQLLPKVVQTPRLADVCDTYLVSFPRGAKEESTLGTERIHLGHFRRILGGSRCIAEVTTQDLQNYVLKRECQKGDYGRQISATTINKELQTFRQLWEYARERGFVTEENPTAQVRKPRRDQKLPFMAWEQIEAHISRGGLSTADIAEMWEMTKSPPNLESSAVMLSAIASAK